MEDATQSGPAPCLLCSLRGVLIAREGGASKDKVPSKERFCEASAAIRLLLRYGVGFVKVRNAMRNLLSLNRLSSKTDRQEKVILNEPNSSQCPPTC